MSEPSLDAVTMDIARGHARRLEPMLADNGSMRFHVALSDDIGVRAVAYIPIKNDDRDEVTGVVFTLASAIDNLLEISFVHDTWHTTQPTRKDGTEWGPGEMEHAVTHQTRGRRASAGGADGPDRQRRARQRGPSCLTVGCRAGSSG